MILLINNALCLYVELCFLLRQGAHFQTNHEKRLSESEKWSRKTLDDKYDGYMWGHGRAKKPKCCKSVGFKGIF